MKKIKELKKKKILFIILGFMLITLQPKAYAALQSNPSTHYKATKAPTTWISEIRNMEAPNNAMGLSEQFNSDLTTKTGTNSNNIDVHMMRNTEYGAIAILAVSGYGNPSTMQASKIKTTTGNVTGVYYNTHVPVDGGQGQYQESIAGGISQKIFSGTNERYYDSYLSGKIKKGDAMNMKWQGVSEQVWPSAYLGRNRTGYFGFYECTIDQYHSYFSRGVAVCGAGL